MARWIDRTVACAALLAAALAGCGDDTQVGIRRSWLRPMPGFVAGLDAMVVDVDDAAQVTYVPPGAVGFEWGVEATIRYHTEDVDDDFQDGPSFVYVLDDELDRRVDPVGTTYSLDFGWWEYEEGHVPLFRDVDDGVLELLHTAQMRCEPALCAELLAVRAAFAVDVELTGEEVPLRAIGLRPR